MRTDHYLGKMKQSHIVLIVGVIALLVLLLTVLARIHNPYPVGDDAHNLLRSAGLQRQGIFYDDIKGEMISFRLITQILAGLLGIFPAFLLAKTVPILLGVLSSVYFFMLTRKLGASKEQSLVASIVLVINPAFLYLFGTLNQYTLTISLVILSAFFYMQQHRILSGLFTILLIVSNPVAFIVLALIAISLVPKWKEYLKSMILPVLIGFVLVFVIKLIMPYQLIRDIGITNFFVDFGAYQGVDIPLLILFSVGFIRGWHKRRLQLNLSIMLLFILSFFSLTILFTTLFFMVMFASQAIINLFKRKWEFEQIKKMALLLVLCTMLFSSVSYLDRLKVSDPSPELIRAIQNLPKGNVFTDEKYNPYITYYASVDVNGVNETGELSQTRDIHLVEQILQEQNIKSIFITKEMREGLVWSTEDQGVLFLLKHSERFINLYRYDKNDKRFEIWVYQDGPDN